MVTSGPKPKSAPPSQATTVWRSSVSKRHRKAMIPVWFRLT